METLKQELLQFISTNPTYEQIVTKFEDAGINLISICLEHLQGDKKIKPRITFELVEESNAD